MVSIYIAEPIDLSHTTPATRARVVAMVHQNESVTTFWPERAFGNGRANGSFVNHINRRALAVADGLAFIVGPSLGSALEVNLALRTRKHVALLSTTDPAEMSVTCAGWLKDPLCRWVDPGDAAQWQNFIAAVYSGGDHIPQDHLLYKTETEDDAGLRDKEYTDDAGWDLSIKGDHIVPPWSWASLPNGVAVKSPDGFYLRLIGRSSASFKLGLMVSEGLLDEGYTGPLFTRVYNPTGESVKVTNGSRLSQVVPCKNYLPHAIELEEEDILPRTSRSSAGFGSTGGYEA